MQVGQALNWASLELAQLEGKADASALLLHVLKKPRSYLFSWPEAELNQAQQSEFIDLVSKRKLGMPVAHLTGTREFWSLPLQVNNSTLIPRPDTETLIEWALELLPNQQARVVDLGTGTGAIALALASERPRWQLWALDYSAEAVQLARANAERLSLAAQITVLQSDWYAGLPKEQYDLIVSNPPYIAEQDPHLLQGDVRFEPRSALTSGVDGLTDLRHLIAQAPLYLKAGAWLLLEHGYDQSQAVQHLLIERGFQGVTSLHDLAGQPRVSGGFWPQISI